MRLLLAALLAVTATAASAATDPRTVPTKLDPTWQAKTRDVFKQAIEIPTVHHRGEMPRMATLLADQFKAAGIPRVRHPFHAVRGAPRRQDRGADRPLALAARRPRSRC